MAIEDVVGFLKICIRVGGGTWLAEAGWFGLESF